VLARTA